MALYASGSRVTGLDGKAIISERIAIDGVVKDIESNPKGLNSVRLDDNRGGHLTRTPNSTGNKKTWTFSCWYKFGNLKHSSSIYNRSLLSTSDGNNGLMIYTTPNSPGIISIHSGNSSGVAVTTANFRDISAWYHIVVRLDTTSTLIKIYINGKEITDLSTSTSPIANIEGFINNELTMYIGKQGSLSRWFDGYMANIHFTDGYSYDASYFGEFDSIHKQWNPKEFTGNFGNNGFHLKFEDSAHIGKDSSGRGNHWTANNIEYYDITQDGPNNNFCMLNPHYWNPSRSNVGIYSEGNLKAGFLADCMAEGTMAVPSGKWYYEAVAYETSGGTHDNMFGVGVPNKWGGDSPGGNTYGISLHQNGDWQGEAAGGDTSAVTFGNGAVIGIAFDVDNAKIWASVNGVWTGEPAGNENGAIFGAGMTGTDEGTHIIPIFRISNNTDEYTIVNFGQDSSFAGAKDAVRPPRPDSNGIGEFRYRPPEGFLAICSRNLPEPAIVDSTDEFNVGTFVGNHTKNNRIVVKDNFNPDLVWVKSTTGDHHGICDVLRGSKSILRPCESSVSSSNNGVLSFNSDGFTMGGHDEHNQNGVTMAYFNWRGGGSGVTNSDGDITSTVSVNKKAGFSIIRYTATGTNGHTVGHGLGRTPEWLVVKSNDYADSWAVQTAVTGGTKFFYWQLTNDITTTSSSWNNVAYGSSVFTIGDDTRVNSAGKGYTAYAWHSVEGFSKIGQYTGNNSTDGTYVYTGFKPAWVMTKRNGATGSWGLWAAISAQGNNLENPCDYVFQINSEIAFTQSTAHANIDMLANGFKNRGAGSENNTAHNINYMAFAESPFKFTRGR